MATHFCANGAAAANNAGQRPTPNHTIKWSSWCKYKARDQNLQVRLAQLAC